MPAESLVILAALFVLVGALYSAVGHAGASGYLAVMALVGVSVPAMRPAALSINILVASIAFVQFARAGHFRWALFWPFAVTSVPAAFLGGLVSLPAPALRLAIGVVLLVTAARMMRLACRPPLTSASPRPPRRLVMLAVGGGLGFIAGLTGTGGGIFLSPVLLLFGWADAKRTAATAALFILVNSVAGVAGLAFDGWAPPDWLWPLAASAATGGLIGATLGSRRAAPKALNLALATVLLIAGAKLVIA